MVGLGVQVGRWGFFTECTSSRMGKELRIAHKLQTPSDTLLPVVFRLHLETKQTAH